MKLQSEKQFQSSETKRKLFDHRSERKISAKRKSENSKLQKNLESLDFEFLLKRMDFHVFFASSCFFRELALAFFFRVFFCVGRPWVEIKRQWRCTHHINMFKSRTNQCMPCAMRAPARKLATKQATTHVRAHVNRTWTNIRVCGSTTAHCNVA